jgi:hypothetical protein
MGIQHTFWFPRGARGIAHGGSGVFVTLKGFVLRGITGRDHLLIIQIFRRDRLLGLPDHNNLFNLNIGFEFLKLWQKHLINNNNFILRMIDNAGQIVRA